jgi:hypothetical protein
MILRRCQPTESRATSKWIAARHYLECCPPGFITVLEFVEGRDLVGAMLLGRPAAREYDADTIMQLHRMFFVDEMPTNTESHGLAMMRKFVRTWFQGIRLLLTYSDPEQGHTGTIYEADGWARLGMTKEVWGYGWNSRGGRRDTKCSKKQRWVRTP